MQQVNYKMCVFVF